MCVGVPCLSTGHSVLKDTNIHYMYGNVGRGGSFEVCSLLQFCLNTTTIYILINYNSVDTVHID